MLQSMFFFYIVSLSSIATSIQSEIICLNDSSTTCHCNKEIGLVTCTEDILSNDTSIDWSIFSSNEDIYHLFYFINFTRLTRSTFTSFPSVFPSLGRLVFTFINGIDRIEENTFKPLNYYSDRSISLSFNAPRNFQLDNYAFGQVNYTEILISGIQYHDIHRSYELNLKAFDKTSIFKLGIRNSKCIYSTSNESSSFDVIELEFEKCSLRNASLLLGSLSESLNKLDLSFNLLQDIPSLTRFLHLQEINLNYNLLREIKSNVFSNLHITHMDLSSNRIYHIELDAFTGSNIKTLKLNDNHIKFLDTVTPNNKAASFLHPLNQTLETLDLSHNYVVDLTGMQNLSRLTTLTMCCNHIKVLDDFSFLKANQLQTIDLSQNFIFLIYPRAFRGTNLVSLDLSGNQFSSLEMTQTGSDEQSKPINRTNSFLYSTAPTLKALSLANNRQLSIINWFVFTKLFKLESLDLTGIPMSKQFWHYEPRNDSAIQWSDRPSNLYVMLFGFHLTSGDYCLSKPVFQILNHTTMGIDANHTCNCFLFLHENMFYSSQRPICLRNQSIVDELTQQCMNIDSYCSSLTTTSTTSLTRVTTKVESSSTASLTTLTTTTGIPVTLGAGKDEGKWRTILAITIPVTVVVLVASATSIYVVRKRRNNKFKESIEMDTSFTNIFARK
ncbi:unnamed protein product [Adineta ricciae]|uniref:Uncharacterized protein n=1 Tax=Adineta ricciae TaxID=249248 RepID=A0A815JAV3_ADIRI|nr:unnamed protein product [Adineta ricciae]CAF1568493.1 unnamed protein product [Adineta ricciae]